MVAYLDLIILENLCMNYLILFTTGKLLNRNLKKSRLFIASMIGALYVFSLYFDVTMTVLNISKIIMSAILVKISFASRKVKTILKEAVVYFLVSFIYAGCALGFIHLAKPRVLYIVNGIIIGGEYIFEIVLISAIASLALIKGSMKLIKFKHKFNKRDMLCNIEVFLNDKSVKLRALLDTGNLLTDPISNTPVVIVCREKIRCLFDNKTLKVIDSLIGGDEVQRDIANDVRVKLIPYTSVGNKNGIMISYKVDKMKVEYQDEVNEVDNVLIGFYNDALSKNDKYSALIGLQILERSTVNGEYTRNVKSKSKYSIC